MPDLLLGNVQLWILWWLLLTCITLTAFDHMEEIRQELRVVGLGAGDIAHV